MAEKPNFHVHSPSLSAPTVATTSVASSVSAPPSVLFPPPPRIRHELDEDLVLPASIRDDELWVDLILVVDYNFSERLAELRNPVAQD